MDDSGLGVFELLRQKPAGRHVFLYAFDLLELNGKGFKREMHIGLTDHRRPLLSHDPCREKHQS
jgi:hypothetical protein